MKRARTVPGCSAMRPQCILFAGAAAVALLLAGPCALAQPSRAPELAAYQGTDRQQRLVEGAKREKELTFYSSIPPEDISALVTAFDKKYGIKVKGWRGESGGVLPRILREARAGRFEGEMTAGSRPALGPAHPEN